MLAVALAAFALAACAPPSGAPESYDEPIVSTTFLQNSTTVSTEVSQTAANLIQGCLDRDGTLPECVCVNDFFVANVPFEEFTELESQLGDDPSSLPDPIRAGVEACREPSGDGGSATEGTTPASPEGTAEPSGTTAPTSVPQ